ncbi:MAG TPA: helix-turn-helix domain-containing protein [Clostridia bacterium]|nr:helix-turn-helix domain-containing protein [Clostridia bacterium]
MENAERSTERILQAAEGLILESDGDTERVTIRQIAERANISVGLVNYYFSSKAKLIEACVQRMIGGVVGSFVPKLPPDAGRAECLGKVAAQVADYLDQHSQISRISILGDLNAPSARDNTIGTTRGFSKTVSPGGEDAESMIRSFCLTAVLQSAFLRKDVLKDCIGVDWADVTQREAFLLRVSGWLLNEQKDNA